MYIRQMQMLQAGGPVDLVLIKSLDRGKKCEMAPNVFCYHGLVLQAGLGHPNDRACRNPWFPYLFLEPDHIIIYNALLT